MLESKDMTAIIEINKNPAEASSSLLRRFTKKVQESGIIIKVKKDRYVKRAKSKLAEKKTALKKLERAKIYEKLEKLGKIKTQYKYKKKK